MNWTLFLPEALLLVLTVILLCLTLVNQDTALKIAAPAVFVTALLALVASAVSAPEFPAEIFYATYRVDLLSQGFKALLALALAVVTLFLFKASSVDKDRRIEQLLFMVTGTLGMMMITSAMDILTLVISLELSAYSLYLLASLKVGQRPAEAGVKYLIFGAAASGVMLWGFSLIAGLAGTTSLTDISLMVPELALEPAFSLGLIFVSFAFLFKLSGFPLHFWAPDVYECSTTPAAAFIATASKAAAVAVFIRVFMLLGVTPAFVWALGMLAFISMTLGNCAALVQKDVKRLLAYSSVAQAGYLLLGFLSDTPEGYSSAFFYALAYIVMNAGAFFVTLSVAESSGDDNPQITHFNGLAERSPFLALILLLSLLSLAGIPPLVGFTGKWILFSAAMDEGHWFLVLWSVLNSVVSLFYYLTLVKHAYLEKPSTASPIALSAGDKMLGLGLFCALVFLGLFPDFFITYAQRAIQSAILP